MPGTTTKMGIQYPTGTDYVKDGASAMQTLATNVDNKSGLVFIKSQTVGTGVTSVTVSAAFSSTFDHYRIQYMGGSASTWANLQLRFGSTTTGYYSSAQYTAYGAAGIVTTQAANAANWGTAGLSDPDGNALVCDVYFPNAAARTGFQGAFFSLGYSRVGGTSAGELNNTTSYTAFTILAAAGTITGGTIRVFGYNQ